MFREQSSCCPLVAHSRSCCLFGGQVNGQPSRGLLEKAMAPHSSVLAWKIPWMEDCSPWGREESDPTERLHFHFSLSCTEERNGNPLQCSCLENPRDGGAWWAAVYGVAELDMTDDLAAAA